MKEVLITILLVGCATAYYSSSRGLFEFHDSYGRCWRCLPGSACVRCLGNNFPFDDSSCPEPNCAGLEDGVTFPHEDIRFYWICAGGEPFEVNCFCDRIYDHSQGSCVYSDELRGLSCNVDDYVCMDNVWECGTPAPTPRDCLNETTTDSTTTASTTTLIVPTVPNNNTAPTVPNETDQPTTTTTETTTTTTTNFRIPTAPNETPAGVTTTTETTTTTTTINGVPDPDTTTTTSTQPPPGDTTTRTTESGGPGASPHTTSTTDSSDVTLPSNTTPAPCVCVVWWPCWCNPCWNMPCHSCHGCVGRMG